MIFSSIFMTASPTIKTHHPLVLSGAPNLESTSMLRAYGHAAPLSSVHIAEQLPKTAGCDFVPQYGTTHDASRNRPTPGEETTVAVKTDNAIF